MASVASILSLQGFDLRRTALTALYGGAFLGPAGGSASSDLHLKTASKRRHTSSEEDEPSGGFFYMRTIGHKKHGGSGDFELDGEDALQIFLSEMKEKTRRETEAL